MTRRANPLPLLALLTTLATLPAAAADPPAGPRLLANLPGPAGTAAPFSRDGKRLLTAGGDEARVWDAEEYKPVTEPLKHGSAIRSAAFSPDGARLVTAADDGAARIWDARTGNLVLSVDR